jgi:polysaccharide export outer membrane protein
MSLISPTFFLTLATAALVSLTTGCQSAPPPQFADVEPGVWSSTDGEASAPAAQAQPEPAAVPAAQTQPEPTAAPAAQTQPAPEPPAEKAPAPAMPAASPSGGAAQAAARSDVFRVDDVVTVTVTGVTAETIPPHEERIKEDGSITLYLVGKVQAAGKTAGELQSELQKGYEIYYKNPVVTVKSAERVYYVGGEVKRPGVQLYLGETTVTKAIQAAGDFTDFALKRSIRVTRADGTTLKVNFGKLLENPRLDPPVYPGDKIHVPRRILF